MIKHLPSLKKAKIFFLIFVFSFLLGSSVFAQFIQTQDQTLYVQEQERQAKEQVKSTWLDKLKKAGATALWSATKNLVNKVAYDAAEYAATGDKGQGSFFESDGFGDFLQKAGDEAAGDMLESLGKQWNFNLCEPDFAVKLKISLGLEDVQRPKPPKCTFSKIVKNWENELKNPLLVQDIQDMFDPVSTDFGVALSLQTQMMEDIEAEKRAKLFDRQESEGEKPQTNASGKRTAPPGQVRSALEAARQSTYLSGVLGGKTGELFIDAANTFINRYAILKFEELMRKLMAGDEESDRQTKSKGIVNRESDPAGGGSIKRVASVVPAEFKIKGDYNLLSELVTCPDPTKAGPNNCVISDNFLTAIDSRMTVAGAAKAGLLNPKGVFGFDNNGWEPNYLEGYAYRSMLILRKHRIIPVGWELAAQYIKDHMKNSAGPTFEIMDLEKMMACFKPDDFYKGYYEEWCEGLVDPDWVLKAPFAYCGRSGAGPDIVFSSVAGQGKSSKLMIGRGDYCAEEQSCIKEGQSGCEAFGYCVEERRTWNFSSASCEPKFASCQSFRTEEGDTASYLKNTLDYGNCSLDSVGCQEYCEDYDYTQNNPTFYIKQGRNSWILPATYKTSNSGAEMYNYRNNSSDMSEFSLVAPNRSELFVHLNSVTGIFSLGFIHDAKNDGSGGRISFTFTEITGGNLITVTDDPGDSQSNNIIVGRELTSGAIWTQAWDDCCTDGGMIEMPFGDWSVTISPKFISGINSWVFSYNEGNISLDKNEPITIEYNSQKKNNWSCGENFGKKMYFDRDVEECDSQAEGCRALIRTKSGLGVNLLPDAGFEDDLAGGFWEGDGESTPDAFEGSGSLRISSAEQPSYSLVKNYGNSLPLAGESFVFSFFAKNCGEGLIGFEDKTASLSSGSDWRKFSLSYVYPVDSSAGAISFSVKGSGAGCLLDAVKLERGNTESGYSSYGQNGFVYEKLLPDYLEEACYSSNNNYSLRSDAPAECEKFARRCNAEEVGCELYTSADGVGIPAKVASQDYCPAECVGYSAYVQMQTSFDSLRDSYFIPRTAKICSAAAVGCDEFTNLDELGSGGEKKEYYSYLRQCLKPSAAGASCRNFYTWEGSDETGYQLKTYKLQAKDSAPAVTENDSVLCNETIYRLNPGAPAYNSDCREFYNTDGATSYHLYTRTITCSEDCHPYRRTAVNYDLLVPDQASCGVSCASASADGVKSCWDAENDVCAVCRSGGRWNFQQKACVYNAIPGEGRICGASENGCREYSGNAGNNIRTIFTSDFEGSTQNWEGEGGTVVSPSNEALSVGGKSLAVTGGATTARVNVSSILSRGRSYSLSFVAKSAGAISISAVFTDGEKNASFGQASLGDEWRSFEMSLLDIGHDISANEALRVQGNGDFYLDNIKLSEISDRYYLIKDSWKTPFSCDQNQEGNPYPLHMLGCEAYTDRDQRVHNLFNFSQLCQESAVGCELLIDTKNTLAYEKKVWNEKPETADNDCANDGPDCAAVLKDEFIYAVYDKDKECQAGDKGCSLFGKTYTYEGQKVFGDVYLKNNPDKYSSSLCIEESIGCREWEYDNGLTYFKDPGDKSCEWRQAYQGDWGWYKKKVKRCDENKSGQIEAGENDVCLKDGDCSAGATCVQDESEEPCLETENNKVKTIGFGGFRVEAPLDGWAGLCPAESSGCTEYIDPVSNLNNSVIIPGKTEFEIEPFTLYSLSGIGSLTCNGVYKLLEDNTYYGTVSNLSAPALFYSPAVNPKCSVSVEDSKTLAVRKSMVDYQLKENIDSSSCNSIVNYENGCILFNERDQAGSKLPKLSWNAFLTTESKTDSPKAGVASENNANKLIKVEPDRVCGRWLACKKVIPGTGANEDGVCEEVGICDYFGDNNQCARFIETPATNQTYVKKSEDNNKTLDYRDIFNMTGYSKVGWSESSVTVYPNDYISLGAAQPVGVVANLANGSFEDFYDRDAGVVIGADENGYGGEPHPDAGDPDEAYYWSCPDCRAEHYDVVDDPIEAQDSGICFKQGDAEVCSLYAPDGRAALQLTADNSGSPVLETALGAYPFVVKGEDYILTLWVNTIKMSAGFAKIIIQELNKNMDIVDVHEASQRARVPFTGNSEDTKNLKISGNWAYRLLKFKTKPETSFMKIKIYLAGDETSPEPYGSAFFDDIKLRPALKSHDLSPNDRLDDNYWYIGQTCRLYPRNDSLACDYFDDSGARYKGWWGHCLEYDRYPGSENNCILWWPVPHTTNRVNEWCGDTYVNGDEDCECARVDEKEQYDCTKEKDLGGTTRYNQYNCTNCAWTNGWCGDNIIQNSKGPWINASYLYTTGEECDYNDVNLSDPDLNGRSCALSPAEDMSSLYFEKYKNSYRTYIDGDLGCYPSSNVAKTPQEKYYGQTTKDDHFSGKQPMCWFDFRGCSDKLVNDAHTRRNCITAGGKVVNKEGEVVVEPDLAEVAATWLPESEKFGGKVVSSRTGAEYGPYFCKFNNYCPSSWTQYLNWSETTNGSASVSGCCGDSDQCQTGYHPWSNKAQEGCSVHICGCGGCSACEKNDSASAPMKFIGCY